jgi:hypothetical protein
MTSGRGRCASRARRDVSAPGITDLGQVDVLVLPYVRNMVVNAVPFAGRTASTPRSRPVWPVLRQAPISPAMIVGLRVRLGRVVYFVGGPGRGVCASWAPAAAFAPRSPGPANAT